MSHSVRINFESISIECRGICEIAANQLCKIDSLLEKINANSSSLINEETKEMQRSLLKRKSALKGKIDSLIAKAQRQAQKV